jgi:hypothetical protein
MKHELPTPEDDIERRVVDDVRAYGFHVIKVMEDEEGPGFAYSVGLFHTLEHPEILIVGLDLDVMHGMISGIHDQIREGRRFEARMQSAGILEGYECAFRVVAAKYYRELFGCAKWFYRGTDFPALQCVWPDMAGNFPWMKDFNPQLRERQPIYE